MTSPAARSVDVDVAVAGGGNAALCAAITARERGCSVLLLERAPWHLRGGNTRHTRNVRCASPGPDGYPEDELYDDLLAVGRGSPPDPELARATVRESAELPAWMSAHGVRWQKALAGTLQLSRTNHFFLGGGKALLNTYYARAARMGVEIRYETGVENLVLDGDRATEVVVRAHGREERIRIGAVVAATGGFEANLEWLRRYWDDAVDNYIVRGTPHNDGTVLRALLEHGAAPIGDPKGFHAVAVDARSPRFDGGIVTRIDAVPFGIVVNRDGARFHDEGEEIWPKRYATWGRRIAEQPGQIAYCVFDSNAYGKFIPPMYPPLEADTVGGVAAAAGIDEGALRATVDAFNRAAAGNTASGSSGLDGVGTRGLPIPKSNWAVPIEAPPFYAIPVRPGITFTYRGVAIGPDCGVRTSGGGRFENVFAAGEIASGNILSSGYLAGFGLTIGTCLGRRAGREAARHAAG